MYVNYNVMIFISFLYVNFKIGDAGSYQVKVIIRFPLVIDVKPSDHWPKKREQLKNCLFAKVTIN